MPKAPASSGHADPALVAVAGMVHAAPMPMAVFDADGACLAANQAFVVAAPDGGQRGVQRTAFSPDGARTWTLATLAAGAPHDLLEAAVNALPVKLCAKDTQGRYLFINRYQAEQCGVAAETVIGRTDGELFGQPEPAEAAAREAEVVRSGRPALGTEESSPAAGEAARHWLTSTVPLSDAGGRVWGVATLALDITERKQRELHWRESVQQAEAGSRAKSRFLGAMSHELRTPLNAVIGFAELMEQEALGPLGNREYVEYAGHILRSGQALLQMITNLLDFARVDAGTLQLRVADVEMVRLVRSVAAGARTEIAVTRDPAAAVVLDLPDGTLAIRGDEARLRQVLGGVIGNALKFTPPSGQVTVSLRPLDGGAEVVVSDSGIGMAPDELGQVFQPFWQADSGLGRMRDGAGIGLRLARELIALHGGTLTLDSRKGDGTCVTVRLPASPPERPATA